MLELAIRHEVRFTDHIAALKKGQYGTVFSSGVSAIDAVIRLLSGDLVVCGDDIYGGTHRLFARVDALRY